MTSQFLFKLTREVATWLTLALVMCACGVSAIPEAAPAAVPDVDGSAALTSPCEPGPSEIALFTDGDFGEPCAIRGIGEYPHSGGNADQMGLEGDTPSSIKVGADVEAVLCTDGNFGGICQKFTTDNAHLGDEKVHDDVTSLKVRQRGYLACVPNADQVALFSHADFVEPCKLKGTNGYTDQAFSSLIVGANMDAILCTYYIGSRCAGYKAFEPEKFSPIYAPAGTLWIEKRGSQSCVPRVNEVALFEFPGSFGPCVVLGVGDYQHSYEMELANDTLASILVGESVQAILCTDANFEGECSDPVTSDNTSLYLGRYYNVGVSSLQVQWRGGCIPNAEQVVLFKDANYHPPCVIKGIGSYHNASEIGLPYHSISSVRVGSSIQLCACKEENFGGSCDVVGTTPSLDSDYQSGRTKIGGDIISSLKVQKQGEACTKLGGGEAIVPLERVSPDCEGCLVYYTGKLSVPTVPKAILKLIKNTDQTWTVLMVKQGRGTNDCWNPEAVVAIPPGGSTDYLTAYNFNVGERGLPWAFCLTKPNLKPADPLPPTFWGLQITYTYD